MIAAILILLGGMMFNGHMLPFESSARAKDSTLKANLVILRQAVEMFQADCGVYPKRLEDLIEPYDTRLPYLAAGLYKGPYLASQGGIGGGSLPRNPYVARDDADVTHHWSYDGVKGTLTFATPVGVDAYGEGYSTY